MKLPKLELGKTYRVDWYDHHTLDEKTPEEASIYPDVILTSWGRLVGINKRYLILCLTWENDTSSNNDNIRIMKCAIKHIKELH